MSTVDLLLDNGELVRIEYPDSHMDAVLESLDNAMKRRDRWAPGQWDKCHATYLGIGLDSVNMARVVGWL